LNLAMWNSGCGVRRTAAISRFVSDSEPETIRNRPRLVVDQFIPSQPQSLNLPRQLQLTTIDPIPLRMDQPFLVSGLLSADFLTKHPALLADRCQQGLELAAKCAADTGTLSTFARHVAQ